MKSTANTATHASSTSLYKASALIKYISRITTKLKASSSNVENADMLAYLLKEVGVNGADVEKGTPAIEIDDSEIISSEASALDLFRRIWDNEMFDLQERLYAIYLDSGDNTVGNKLISVGTTTIKNANPSEIIKHAKELSAAKIILAHNHPSGATMASASDLKYTSIVLKALESEDLELVSHFILTRKSYHAISLSKR